MTHFTHCFQDIYGEQRKGIETDPALEGLYTRYSLILSLLVSLLIIFANILDAEESNGSVVECSA